MEIYDLHDIHVSRDIAVCPYCGGSLKVSEIAGADYDDNNKPVYLEVHLDCTVIPECSNEFELHEWHEWHCQMPYVYWLPVRAVIGKWLLKQLISGHLLEVSSKRTGVTN